MYVLEAKQIQYQKFCKKFMTLFWTKKKSQDKTDKVFEQARLNEHISKNCVFQNLCSSEPGEDETRRRTLCVNKAERKH